MKHTHRAPLVALLLAFGVVACSDDPTPTTTPPAALRVTLMPESQTINVGAVADYAVGVTGGEGTAVWTCTSSSTAATVVVIPIGCRVTGVSAGSVTIIAAVTKGSETVNAAASLTVNAVVTTPATVTISAINQLGAPAPLNAIVGQVDVVLNVDHGTEVVQRVELRVGTMVVASQTFSAAAVAAAAVADGPDGQAIHLITLSFLSSCYTDGTAGAACGTVNATTGTALARHQNGPQAISAQLFVSGGGTSLRSSNTVMLNFANVSRIHIASTTLPTNSAMDANGLVWYGGPNSGSVSFTAVPVAYGPGTANSVSATLCGTTITDTTAPFQFSFTCGSTFAATANPLDPPFETAVGGAAPTLNWALSGNPQAGGIVNTNHPFPVRLDFVPPQNGPTFVANPNVRQNGWLNAAVMLDALNESPPDNPLTATATPDGWLVDGADCTEVFFPFGPCPAGKKDTGVGGSGPNGTSYTRRLRVDATDPTTVNAARLATASATPALPAPSLSNTSYCAIVSAVDRLGNETALPAAATPCLPPPVAAQTLTGSTHLRFGVDTTAPTIAFCTGAGLTATCPVGGNGLTADQRRNTAATVGLEFRTTVADVGTIGNSGMQSNSAVVGTVRIARPGLPVICLVGTVVPATGACTPASVNPAPAFPEVATTAVSASAAPGYYFARLRAQDAAGNLSAEITRVAAYDLTANTPSLTTALYNIPLTGGTVTFNANASDNFDLRDVRYAPAFLSLAGPLAYPLTTISPMPAATADPATVVFRNANQPAPGVIPGFMRQVQIVTNGIGGPLTTTPAEKPVGVLGYLRDQADVTPAPSPVVTFIPPASVTTGVSFSTVALGLRVADFRITSPTAATLVSTGDAIAPIVAANPLSVTITAEVSGATATFNSPFQRVDFYVLTLNALPFPDLEQIGSVTSFTTTDNGVPANGRKHAYSMTWTPGASSPIVGTPWGPASPAAFSIAQTVIAIGVTSQGDALSTPNNTSISITRP